MCNSLKTLNEQEQYVYNVRVCDEQIESIFDDILELVNSETEDFWRVFIPLLKLENQEDFVFSDEDWIPTYQNISQKAQNIKNILSKLIQPTYTVASYWSPLDESKRYSVIHFDEDYDYLKSLKYAYAFYSLTLRGKDLPVGKKLWSIVQYMGDHASHEKGLFTCYAYNECKEKDCFGNKCTLKSFFGITSLDPDKDLLRWICCPSFIKNELLEKLGINRLISSCLGALETPQLKQRLQDIFEGGNESDALSGFPEKAIEEFEKNYQNLPENFNIYIENLTLKLNQFYHTNNNKKKKISPKQACFMIMTHLIWREITESTFMYIFPVSVRKSCCVLAMGKNEPLLPLEEISMAQIARSLFFYPLLADYEIKAKQQEELAISQTYVQLFGHNLSKIAFIPSAYHIWSCINLIKNNSINDKLEEIKKHLFSAQTLLEHYETFFFGVMASSGIVFPKCEKEEEVMHKLPDLIRPNEDIKFLYIKRGEYAYDQQRCKLKIKGYHKLTNVKLKGKKEFLEEIFINIITNAWSVAKIRENAEVNIHISCEKIKDGLIRINIEDDAKGFKDDSSGSRISLERINDNFKQIQEKYENELSFHKLLRKLVEDSLNNYANENFLGIGLIFCAAYLRWLEWDPFVKKAGEIKIKNYSSGNTQGAIVSLIVPGTID